MIKKNLSRRRVHINAIDLTVFPTNVFKELLGKLRLRHSAMVYFLLYNWAWHRNDKKVFATFSQLADRVGLDYRTVKECIDELESKRLIIKTAPGTPGSRDDLPCWEVPATKFDMGRGGHGWVPVPSFIITRYMPVAPECTLLPLLMYYQNMGKKNRCFPSVATLAEKSGWRSKRRVYDALAKMGQPEKWEKLETGMPRPLKVWWESNTSTSIPSHRYRVLAIHYFRFKDKFNQPGLPELELAEDFAAFFKIKKKRSKI